MPAGGIPKDENDSPPPERSSEKLKIEPQGPRPHP